MSVDKPTEIEIPKPETVEKTTYTTCVRGGYGNRILKAWSYDNSVESRDAMRDHLKSIERPILQKPIDKCVHEVKTYYVCKPRLVNRRGKIIRFQRSEELT